MDVSDVRRSFYGTWHANYVELDDLTPVELDGVPELWRELVSGDEGVAARQVADRWREWCPKLPRVADFLEEHTLQMGLSRMTTPHHVVREYQLGDRANYETTEIALVYLVRDLDGVAPFNVWIARRPALEQLPPWWDSVRAVVGDLATEFHDGFMLDSWEEGLLSSVDMPTVSELWIDYIDPTAEGLYVHREDDYSDPILREQWPDFTQLRVIAEGTSNRAWAVDQTTANNSGWGDGADTLHPIGNLANSIEEMLGESMGYAPS